MSDPLTNNYTIDPATLSMNELGALVDSFHGLRQRKTELAKMLSDVTSEGERIRKLIIAALEFQNVTAIGGSVARVQLKYKDVPSAASWPDIHAHLTSHPEDFDILHRRLSESAIRERWAAGVSIPGVESVVLPDLSVTKVPR